jgi:pullulanase
MNRVLAMRLLAVLAVIAGAGVLGRATGAVTGPTIARADANTTLIVHYHRFSGDYGPMDTSSGWNLWLWPYMPQSLGGAAYPFDGTDAFGEVSHDSVPGANTQVGLIVRLGDWQAKDISNDRHVDTPNQHAEIWLIQGDSAIYTSLSDAEAALASASKTKPVNAHLDGVQTAVVKLSHPTDLGTLKLSDWVVTDKDTGATIAVTAASDLTGATTGLTDTVQLTLASAPDITHRLSIQYQDLVPIALTPRLVLDDPKYYYSGNDLGAVWSPSATTFRVWAPLATAVNLLTYKDASGGGEQSTPMTKSDNGTWFISLSGDQKNAYYLYQVTNFGKTATAVDPYARNISVNGTYGQVVDLKATDPKGWSSDHYRKTGAQTNASLYEVHVRDFSISPNSGVKPQWRGKYLAFTQHGTKGPGGVKTGVDSLKQLGITHVELLPIQGCSSLDEIKGGSTDPAPNGDSSRYNWCYDPRNYNAPNGAYATNPNGTTRITEVKQMVQSLHKDGLGVVVDVVYNHTHDTSVFDPIVPGYYYRSDYAGNIETASGAGPDLAAERPMVQKFIIDSTSYWMKEYHLDGFRFDLMSLLGTKAVTAISTALHKINPSTVMLGEPWDLGASPLNDVQYTKDAVRAANLPVGVFNDDIRNGLEGNVFQETQPGYATGDPTQQVAIMKQVVGNIRYTTALAGFAYKPEQAINYVSSHDNLTLWDRIQKDTAAASLDDATKVRMDEFAEGIVFTSQGVPFMQGGDEMLRTKGGNDNSYQAGDAINEFDWSRKGTYAPVFNYYTGLIHLRAAHPAFRMNNPDQVVSHLTFLNSPQNTIEFELHGHANKDSWKNIVVIYNPDSTATSFTLPSGKWNAVGTSGKIGTKTIGHASGKVSVPGYTMDVLHQ